MNYISEIMLVLDSKNHLKNFDNKELESRVEILLNRGFVYNPYSDKFFNPFFDNSTKIPSRLLTHSKWGDFFINLDSSLKLMKEYRKSEDEITQKYNRETNHFLLNVKILSGIIGIILFLLGLVSFFFLSLNVTIICGVISYLFLKYYFVSNGLKTNYFGDYSFEVSPFWTKNKNKFLVSLFINFFVLLYFLYLLTGSVLIVVTIGLVLHFVSNAIFTFIEERDYIPTTVFRTLCDDDYVRKFNKSLDTL